MTRTPVLAAALVVAACAGTAYAGSGSTTDPAGDYPDITKFTYSNAKSKVAMTLTVADGPAQNQSFYLRWSKGRSYQVFSSPSANILALRYYASAGADMKTVACKGLSFKQVSASLSKASVPRSCLKKAPDALRFQAIATEGTSLKDETKVSKAIKRG